MTIEEFGGAQASERRAVLSRLLPDCARRFRQAGNLVGIGGPVFDAIGEARYEAWHDRCMFWPLWKVLCHRYRTERFDEQHGLFIEHDDESMQKWTQFLYWHLFPILIRDAEFVRNVLRVAGLLPCRSKERSAEALASYVGEMTLPYREPTWER